MNLQYTKILFIIIVLISFLSLNYYNTTSHEKTHVAIAENYNCEDISIEYSDFLRFKGVTHSTCLPNPDKDILDSYNEIINYNVGVIVSAIFLVGLVIVAGFFTVLKAINKEKDKV